MFGDMLRFYLPLMATNVLMMSTHSVISNAIARSFNPVAAMAGYSAAYSVGQFLDSVNFAAGRMCLTYTGGQKSYRIVLRATQILVGAAILGFLAVTVTPLSKLVLGTLLGLKGDVYQYTLLSLGVMTVFPFVDGLRQVYQTQIVLKKRTMWMSVNMAMRVAWMLLAASFLPSIWPKGPIGAFILMGGIAVEGSLSFLAAKKWIPPLEPEGDSEIIPSVRQTLIFAAPLVLAGLVQNMSRPIVTGALSRTLNPELTLAGYQVALSFSYIFASVTYSIYQAVLVFVKDSESYFRVRMFCLGMGAVFSLLTAAFALPSIGTGVFVTLIGTEPSVTREALKTLLPLAIIPLAAAVAEFYDGVLTLTAHSVWVTWAKITNVLFTSAVAIILVGINPGFGGVAGGLALALGSLAEAVLGYYAVHRLPDTRVLTTRTEWNCRVHQSAH